MEIINALTEELKVTEEQAKGGAGAIFKLAKEKLGDEKFGKVSELIPEMDELLKAAPESSGIAGAVGGVASSLGGRIGHMGNLAVLGSEFKKLGLGSDMVARFVPSILSFIESKGGVAVRNTLAGVLE